MTELAEEIREFLIQTLSKTGGHLGPNLGVVELTLALHTVFNTPEDKCSSTSATRPTSTRSSPAASSAFETIRQPGGLNGFMLRTESEHDCYGAGHAGTALSAALGMAVARDLAGGKEHVVAVAGDAAFTNGITFEALNNIAEQTKRMIVVLNDNEWSIDRNVGAIARYFHRIVTNEHYQHLHDSRRTHHRAVRRQDRRRRSRAAPKRPPRACCGPPSSLRSSACNTSAPSTATTLPLLIETFKFLKSAEPPGAAARAHAKGPRLPAGARRAEEVPRPGPLRSRDRRDQAGGPAAPTPKSSPTRWPSWPTRTSASWPSPRPCPTAPASISSGRTIPKRYFDVGIAEEHAVVFAAGMATRGFRPVCAIYSTFLQRAFDPIVHDVCLQKLPVVFCMDRAGLSGDDGPTHHGLFDIGYLRGIPEMVLMAPKDEDELADMMKTALELPGPSAIRYPRGAVAGVARKAEPQSIPVGKAEVLGRRLRRGHSRPGPDDRAGAGAGRSGSSATATPPRSSIRASSSRSIARCWSGTLAAWPPSSPLKIT